MPDNSILAAVSVWRLQAVAGFTSGILNNRSGLVCLKVTVTAVYCSIYAARIELYSAYAVYCSIYTARIELYSACAVYCSIYAARIELYSACAV